ncbi:MAG: Translation initiation factor IF-2, partial [Parcubacteria group bacterium GW2011_GWA2_44_12]
MNTKNQYLKTGNFWKVIMLIMGVSAMTFFVLARLSFAQSEAEDIAPVKEQLQPLEEPSRQLEPAQAETVQNALEAETETQIKKANDGIKNSEIKDLALELGLFQPTEEFREIEQKDDTIKITGKILLGTARPASSKEGLSIVKGDIENRRDEILFFEEQGKRKETIKLADLISEAQKDQLSEASLTPSAQRAIEVGSGDTTATLSAALRGLERREDIKVNVEGIEVRKKGADFFEKVTKSIFKPQKDEVKDEEKRYEIEVSNTGEVKLLKAEAVQGNEELEIEYSYGVFSSPFQINSVFLSLKEPLAVDTLSAKQVEKVANKIEENALKFFSDIKDKKTPAPAEQEVETAPVNETSGEETAPSIEEVPQEEPAQSEPVVEEEIASEEVPVPPQNPKPEEEVQPASQSEGEVSASEAPQPPVEEKDISMPPISKINALKSAARSVFEIITKRFSLERDGGNMFIESARAQTTSVEAFQIKLKAATSKGEQTFQILPDGTVYLYHGSSIEAISKPKVQFLQDARWSDYTITRAQVGTLSDELTAVHIIKLDTLEEDEITLKYDFGLKEGVLLKKQTWQVDSDKTVRAVWETFLRPGSKSEKALQQRVSRNAPKTRTTLYENIVIDTADYPGNVEIEEIPEDHIVRVYFEKEGIQAPFVVDPSFSVITSDSFIEVATPDYLDAESQDGWKVRFNKLFGGTIDGYYRNSVDNGITNIASSAKPLFNIAYTNAEVFKDSAQQSAQVMEVLERGDTRVRVHSQSILGADSIDVFYTVYLAGQIYIEVEHTLSDGAIAGQGGVFQLNQSYAGYHANFPMVDTNVKSAGINATQSDTALIAFEPGEIGSVTSSASETGDYIQV